MSGGYAGNSSGAVLVYATFSILALMTVLGLAIDAANLVRVRQQLQKAADAGVLAAFAYRIEVGRDAVADQQALYADGLAGLLHEKARQTVLLNLGLSGLPSTSDTPVTTSLKYRRDPSGQSTEISLSLARHTHYLFMNVLPLELLGVASSPDGQIVAVTATARKKRSNVAILFDLSHSMGCPVSGSCECLQNGGCGGRKRIDDLIDGMKAFVEEFDLDEDIITFVPFGTAATAFSRSDLGLDSRLSVEAVDATIAAFKRDPGPQGNTNLCDALMRGWDVMRREASEQEIAYVVFSDGAPTAGRFLFTAPRELPPWNPSDLGAYDYSHFAVFWQDAAGGSLAGPSVLYQTGLVELGYSEPQLPANSASPQAAAGAARAACSAQASAPYPPAVQFPEDMPVAAAHVFGKCLGDLGFHQPGKPDRVFAAGRRRDDAGFGDWQKQYYNCAVVQSDLMREQRGTFYVIGHGEAAPSSSDPYQNVSDSRSRKDVFLSRLADDYWYATAHAPDSQSVPEFDFTGYQSFQSLSSGSNPRPGKYYPLSPQDDPADRLKKVFKQIAHEINLSLVG